MRLDYRSRWQQKRQERASRHRLVVIGVLLAGLVVALLIANTRRVHTPASLELPAIGPSWLTVVDDGLLVCHREGRLLKLTWDLSNQGTGWARPFSHPAGFTGRVASGQGLAFVSCADARLRAVDLVSGVQRWETVVGGSAAEPVAAGDGVFFGADDGKLYAVSAADGVVRWAQNLGARVASAPLVTEERIVAGTIAGLVHCLRRSDGEKLWRAELGGPVYSSPRAAGARYLVGADDGVLYALDAEGKITGTLQMNGIIRAPVGLAGGEEGAVAIVGDSGGVVCRFDPMSMQEQWRRKLAGPVPTAPVLEGERVWCAAGPGVVCLRMSSGGVMWRRRSAMQTIDCVLGPDAVYWTTAAGRVHRETIRR